jgi:hypothetical protein
MRCPHCHLEFDPPGWPLEECVAMATSPTVGMRRADAEAFWAHYAAVDFVDAAGRKITNLRAALLKWKTNQPSHGKKYRDSNPEVAATEKLKLL